MAQTGEHKLRHKVADIDPSPLKSEKSLSVWKIIIADDEEQVHAVSELVLADFQFEQKKLDIIHTHSASETRLELIKHPDTAVLLLDVVMESDHAGLDLVKEIRNDLNNRSLRIILCTGQPGQAPEERVIIDYDINDYCSKTELTARRLKTTLYTALRSYRDISAVEASQRSLQQIIESSPDIYRQSRVQSFAEAAIVQLSHMPECEDNVLYARVNTSSKNRLTILAATGNFESLVHLNAYTDLPEPYRSSLIDAAENCQNSYEHKHFVLAVQDKYLGQHLLFLGTYAKQFRIGHQVLSVFWKNLALAFENLQLQREINNSQVEMLHILANAVETRAQGIGNHVKRVAETCELLALEYGLNTVDAEIIKLAAPLHDIGKISIPDHILNKAGALTEDEWTVMRTHSEIGWRLLKQSKRPVMQIASQIAKDHHEHWDGSGYPHGISGDAISLPGRIVAVADNFDALGSKRCYKTPWKTDHIRSYFESERGKKFEPKLVDILFDIWDEAMAYRALLPDRPLDH